MTAPNHIQYIPSTTFTASFQLADIPVPPGSSVRGLFSITNGAGVGRTINVRIDGKTKSGTYVLFIQSPSFSGNTTTTLLAQEVPDIIRVGVIIAGTSPTWDLEVDLIITPPTDSIV